MRSSGHLGTMSHDVMKRAIILHVLEPVVPSHVLALDGLWRQRLLVHRAEDQLVPSLQMNRCEDLFELVLILEVSQPLLEA